MQMLAPCSNINAPLNPAPTPIQLPSCSATAVWGNSELQKEQTLSAQVGREAEEKHQGGQTAMKSPMLPASVEIGTANCPNPEQVLIPPKQGDTAKASPNLSSNPKNMGVHIQG
ncbi:hypothetical protein NQZ68_002615 [Dissostichus eleginoides]|nr:hypothetical protein NQZ68_002615 [Dissostichus eleginoides]